MRVDVATIYEIRDVAMRMRESDLREFLAVNRAETRAGLADVLVYRYGLRPDVLCFHNEDGAAIGIGGALELRPNVLTLLFYATDDFPSIAVGVTRFVRNRLFPPLIAAGAHRIEATSIEDYESTHRWIEVLGLSREFEEPLRGYGKNGEAFAQFAWVKEPADADAPGA